MNPKTIIEDLMETVIREGGSDLHLPAGAKPSIRVDDQLIHLESNPPITHEQNLESLDMFLSAEQKERFFKEKQLDFSYNHKGQARFRCNVYYQRGEISIALRVIPKIIRTYKELNLPPILDTFASKKQGFFLVVGPVGQGKTTLLESMIESINKTRAEHIITIEDPIEYIFENKKSIIEQREVHTDTENFHTGLHATFRQDVDVIMVGEMRGPETMSTAVTAGETGHLVFSTLHTNDASQTVNRIIDSFPPDQQGQIRLQLAASLLGIFSIRLLPRISGGLIPAYELLINNAAVANLIREKRTHELNNVIETSSKQGMVNMNHSLADLVRSGEVAIETALLHAPNPEMMEKLL